MAADNVVSFCDEGGIVVQAEMGDVVVDADGEMVLGLLQLEVFEDPLDHGRREFLGGKAVAASNHLGKPEGEFADRELLPEDRNHVLIKGLARGARLLRSIENGDAFDRPRHGLDKGLGGERPAEADLDEADLLAALDEVLNRLVRGFGARAHHHDDSLRIGGADVIEELVLAASDGGELVHGLLHDGRERVVKGIDALPSLEEDVGVLRRSAENGMLR